MPIDQPGVEHQIIAFLDNEDSETIDNPIHSTAVAQRYGFDGPLVGGVTTWGWCTPAILEALGDEWLDHGWAEFRFRRPIYPDNPISIRLSPHEDTSNVFDLTMTNGDSVDCVVGAVGLGDGAWINDFTTPGRMDPAPSPTPRPDLRLDPALIGQDWTPQLLSASVEELQDYATASHRLDDDRFIGLQPRIHPAWLAARAERIMRHNFSMPTSIHTESRVQYLAPAWAGQSISVGAHCLDVFERKGRHLIRFDCLIRGEDGTDLARLRHTTIFKQATD
jgi:acyl dehydratase